MAKEASGLAAVQSFFLHVGKEKAFQTLEDKFSAGLLPLPDPLLRLFVFTTSLRSSLVGRAAGRVKKEKRDSEPASVIMALERGLAIL